ncbi:HNH endonuclease [Alteraurantiacibacter aestuarii]|uniref:Restriction endonuclease n=1 Tax=Alteraurantiacibacter aestuarii TaxID=650004 RepID=A0A844ZJ91_9SPHN|nr:HNH endonuclease [Alteraurantiacibacter aestuarii]MXO87654.1 restriction endonuclease [Alteraurantiacibacter aestuarii]
MSFGVFIHRADSIYNDSPAERYQFPPQYLGRAEPSIGNWIVYLEPTKVPNSRGYFAAAKVEKIIPDPTNRGMYLALIEPGTYIDFANRVPFSGPEGPIERGLLNDAGALSGRAQSAVRPLSGTDFARIVEAGLPDDEDILPRIDHGEDENRVREVQTSFEIERPIVQTLLSRKKRDRLFRRAVLAAYDSKCAMTGWKLINGGGRAETEAAHIRPVEHKGPDSIQNGIALSGTVHWMFDRGLIGLSDDLDILISRQVNDRSSVEAILNKTGKALTPERMASRPHPTFLQWHREYCFKG